MRKGSLLWKIVKFFLELWPCKPPVVKIQLIGMLIQGKPDWKKLVEQGRAKAIGVPWSEEELVALNDYKIPPEYVRKGFLDAFQYLHERSKDK